MDTVLVTLKRRFRAPICFALRILLRSDGFGLETCLDLGYITAYNYVTPRTEFREHVIHNTGC
jgi:hypothetical protein